MTCNDKTKRTCALIGNPVAHSASFSMHNALYESAFLPWNYQAILCEDNAAARNCIELVRDGEIFGMNITYPFKKLALKLADNFSEAAQIAGGANVLLLEDGRLIAHNTDGAGFFRALLDKLHRNNLQGTALCICGTGPTARVIAYECAYGGADAIRFLSRDEARAKNCAQQLKTATCHLEKCAFSYGTYECSDIILCEADLVINATPVGLNDPEEMLKINIDALTNEQLVIDLMYASHTTALLHAAKRAGAATMNGLEMLVQQAALSAELWFEAAGIDVSVNRDIMRNAAKKALSKRG